MRRAQLKIGHEQAHRVVFPPEVRAEVTALACTLPVTQGKKVSRWSASTIAAQLVALELVTSIAACTVGRWLKAEKLRPWRYHSWQHILDPETFLERARPVLQLYADATALLQEQIWVVCADEKTSIQARQPDQPTRAAQENKPQLVSSRYQRRGFVHLFAALSVADGWKVGQTFSRKRFVDFQTFILESIVPQAQRRGVRVVKLILDNGSTHAPKQLQAWLNAQSAALGWPFTIEIVWLPVNASWLDQIEIWFSVLQRKVLQPNDFDSAHSLSETILEFIRCENLLPKPIKWTYTIDKLEAKLGKN